MISKILLDCLIPVFCLLVIAKIYLKFTTGWCNSQVCLKGKTVIVTGGNAGIGYETALDVAKRGARVILACRDEQKGKNARDTIIKETNNTDIVYKLVDYVSLNSVKKFAEEILTNEDRLDVLVNNIGVETMDDQLSEDGLSLLMQVNYFAPVLLTMLLIDKLRKTSGRIVNVSSITGKIAILRQKDIENLNLYLGRLARYPRTKLCNILFTIALSSRLKGTGVTTYSLHPGIVNTQIFRSFPVILRFLTNFLVWLFFKSPVEGAQTTIYCAVADDIEKYNGEHFHDCHVVNRYYTASDPVLAENLWIKTMTILKLEENIQNYF